MPEIYIYALEGRTLNQKRKLVKEVTEVIARNLHVAEDAVVIQFIESSREAKAKGGVLFVDPPPAKSEERCCSWAKTRCCAGLWLRWRRMNRRRRRDWIGE